jgi:DNA-binding transcriptional regulator YiaG
MGAKTITGKAAVALREKLKLSQADFWQRLGVSQSCGSRYENDRAIPRHIYLLLQLAYDSKPERAYRSIRYDGQLR